jgi:hypothetical protein
VLKRVNGRVVEDAGAYRGALDELWEMFGADRVMYGSNWPVDDRLAAYPVELNAVREYVLTWDELQRQFATTQGLLPLDRARLVSSSRQRVMISCPQLHELPLLVSLALEVRLFQEGRCRLILIARC